MTKTQAFALLPQLMISGRLQLFSNEPGIQFYSGNFLDGSLPSKKQGCINIERAFVWKHNITPTLQTRKNFPTVRLNPGEQYKSTI